MSTNEVYFGILPVLVVEDPVVALTRRRVPEPALEKLSALERAEPDFGVP